MQARAFSAASLKGRLAELIPEKQEQIMKLKKEHGDTKLQDVTVNNVRFEFSICLTHR